MELYPRVRLACAEGMSQREAAKRFNLSRDTVRKMLSYSEPPGYRRTAPVRRPKLEAFIAIIDAWLDQDRQVPRKQCHTAKRVFDRLREEHGPSTSSGEPSPVATRSSRITSGNGSSAAGRCSCRWRMCRAMPRLILAKHWF